jgi:hypothetical protein
MDVLGKGVFMRKLPYGEWFSGAIGADRESSRIGGYRVQPNLLFYVQCRQDEQLE